MIILEKRNRNGTWPREGGVEEDSPATDSFDFVKLLQRVEDLEKQVQPQKIHSVAQKGYSPSLNPFLVADTTSRRVIEASLPTYIVQKKRDEHQSIESLQSRITDLERQLNESQRSKQDITQNYQRRLSEVQQQSSELGQQLVTYQQQLQESRLATQEATRQKNSSEQQLHMAQETLRESTL